MTIEDGWESTQEIALPMRADMESGRPPRNYNGGLRVESSSSLYLATVNKLEGCAMPCDGVQLSKVARMRP